MKSVTKILVILTITLGSLSSFALTGATGCSVSDLIALEGSNELYASIKCESGSILVVAKSEAVKSVLLVAKSSDKKVGISVSADNAFSKSSTTHTIERVEIN